MTVASTNIGLDASINNEWSDAAGTTNVSLSEFYRGGSIVTADEFTSGIPSSGQISFSQFTGKQSNASVSTGTLAGYTDVYEEEIGPSGASVTATANTIATITFTSTQIKVDIQCIGNITGGTGGGTINETNGGASFNALTINRTSNNTFNRWKIEDVGSSGSQNGTASSDFSGSSIVAGQWYTTSGETVRAYSTATAANAGDSGDATTTGLFRLYYDYDASGVGKEVPNTITVQSIADVNWSVA